MDPQNLHTASVYVNNLLLSRGLLRNGTPIEFAKPSKAEGGKDATMAKIINLVHDLLLRRDRETELLATLSQNTQTLRLSDAQQRQSIARLESRNADLDRQLALSAAQERSAKATLRAAETRNRTLRENMARLKLTVAQIRGQCANDIRKRDNEIKRLKRHLEGRRGREGNGGQVGVVVVTPGMDKNSRGSRETESEVDIESPQYSLRQETTEFLTQLTQNLSDENDALVGLMRNTLETLRHLQGLPQSSTERTDGLSDIDNRSANDPNVVLTMPPSYEALASDTEEVLEQLRALLTSPSFVSIEEVAIREDEIIRLREGWERMEARWREAVALMDGWRKRMMTSGDTITINLEDLHQGLNLGSEVATKAPEQNGDKSDIEPRKEQSQHEFYERVASEGGHANGNGEENTTSADDHSSPDKVSGHVNSGSNGPVISLLPASKIMRPTTGNVRRRASPRKVSFNPIPEKPNKTLNNLEDDLEEISLLNFANIAPEVTRSPSSSQDDENGPEMTIQQKLEKAHAEAEEAVRKRVGEESIGTAGKKSVAKNAGAGKSSTRRRSTLSPAELEDLLGIS